MPDTPDITTLYQPQGWETVVQRRSFFLFFTLIFATWRTVV
jgi:hypothetical protein